jgi:hypothetical protein
MYQHHPYAGGWDMQLPPPPPPPTMYSTNYQPYYHNWRLSPWSRPFDAGSEFNSLSDAATSNDAGSYWTSYTAISL